MSVALRTITRLQDADDINVSLGVGVDEYALCWDNDTAKFVLRAMSAGVTDHGALTGLADDDHTQYLLATGARTGASSQAQTFTSGIIGPTWKPAADSTTALQMQNAAGTAVATVDTSNGRIGIGKTPTVAFDLVNSSANNIAAYLNKNDAINWSGVYYGFAMANGSNEFGLTVGAYNAGGNKIIRLRASGSPSEWRWDAAANDILRFEQRFIAKAGLIGAYHTDLDIVLNHHTNGGADKGIKFKVAGGGTTAAVIMETGRFGVGTAAPGTLIHGLLSSAATNAVTNVLTIGHNSTGTAANGFGAGQAFTLATSTTADQSAARIQALWNDATHASRKADLVLTAYDSGGEREGLRIRGAGSAPAIGFLGAAPVTRIAHVADPAGGATVDAEARSAINSILTTLESFGFHATS